MGRGLSPIVAALALTTAVVSAAPQALAADNPAPSTVSPPITKYVDVSVATSWIDPGTNRPGLHDVAISNPADPRRWVASMTVKQKLALNDLLETQALYGT